MKNWELYDEAIWVDMSGGEAAQRIADAAKALGVKWDGCWASHDHQQALAGEVRVVWVFAYAMCECVSVRMRVRVRGRRGRGAGDKGGERCVGVCRAGVCHFARAWDQRTHVRWY